MVKDTGFSVPFKLSFKPELCVTYKGAEILDKFNSLPNSY